jgi:pyridoxal phosphate enzyme (YggS family)
MTREEDVAAGLNRVWTRIRAACERAGRSPGEITVVTVTKLFPASDADILARLGITDIGENRDQEAAGKVAAMALRHCLRVHFIGQLQTNKAASVARYADVIQSIDRPKLVTALDRGLAAAGRRAAALVQVRLDDAIDPGGLAPRGATGAPGRGGVPPAQAAALADAIAGSRHLDLRGVMAIAPLGADPAPAFACLREVAHGIRDQHPGADWISAGMSGDLEEAIEHGATHLRVGTAILGSRTSHR